MKRILWMMAGLLWWSGTLSAQTNWVNLSQGLAEPDIQCVMAHAQDSKIIFAASTKRLYRTADGGKHWRQVLTLQSRQERIRSLSNDALNPALVYLCADREVYRSMDRGKQWELFFTLPGNGAQTIFCVANEVAHPEILWLGTNHGLIQFDQKTSHTAKVDGLPELAVYFIFLNQPNSELKLISTNRGVYRHVKGNPVWERVFADHENEQEQAESLTSQQFGIEELPASPSYSNLVFLSGQNKFYAATQKGVLEGSEKASAWAPVSGASLPDKKINFVASSKKILYVATDRGVFQWDERSHFFRELYLGLATNEVRSLDYNAAGDYLLAATKNGIYRFSNPDLSLSLPINKELGGIHSQDIFERFANEPTITEVQEAAIHYAEVSPKKIEEWRNAAAHKAWAPTLSLHQNTQSSDNIDIDRGGTGDPDKFIKGPQDKSFDWYATASWDLGNLIWNSDQTSIDSRSKMMVELRNDILNEVTHLYFERRRLQVETAMAPPEILKDQLEYQIRLEELTSQIDALTGGFLSKRIGSIR